MKKIIITICCMCLITNIAHAANSKDIAIVLKSEGEVKIRKSSPKTWNNAQKGDRLDAGDIIKTGDHSLAAIMFTDDKSLLKVRDNSSLSVRGQRDKSTISKKVTFALGQIWVKVTDQKSEFLVETPSGVAAVKGTEFYTIVDQNGNTTIFAIQGLISFKNKFGEILIQAGETALATKLTAPTVAQTDGNQLPQWGSSNNLEKEFEIEFQDSEGNTKKLKINYREQ